MSSTKIKWTPGPEVSAETYAAGDAKVKGKIRSALQKSIFEAVAALDADTAKAIQDHLASLKSTPEPRPEVPVETIIAQRIATLQVAAMRLLKGFDIPDGMTREEINFDKVEEVLKSVDKSTLGDDASKIASQKITRSAKVNDVGQAILDALAAVPAGTVLTVAQVAATVPGLSDGAVAARLFTKDGPKEPTGNLAGKVVPVPATADRARGVRLA